ncbi:hypothetical protein ACQR3P_28880 [Rhodococcus sp. IEGM1300]
MEPKEPLFSLDDMFSSTSEQTDEPSEKELVTPCGESTGFFTLEVPDISTKDPAELMEHVAYLSAKVSTQEILLNVIVGLCMKQGLFDDKDFEKELKVYADIFDQFPKE